MAPAEPFVTIASFTTAAEAEVARVSLENDGIPCVLADSETVSMLWSVSNAVGGVKVQVAQSNVARATRLLARRRRRGDDYGLEPLSGRQTEEPRERNEIDLDDEPEAAADEADRTVRRALFTAVFGLAVCPFAPHVWSLWLLLDLFSSGGSPQVTKRGWLWFTLLLDVVVVFVGVMYVLSSVLR